MIHSIESCFNVTFNRLRREKKSSIKETGSGNNTRSVVNCFEPRAVHQQFMSLNIHYVFLKNSHYLLHRTAFDHL